MRTVTLWNEDFIFEKEGKTEPVNLPHTWNAIDGQSASDYYRGTCRYTKHFAKPQLTESQQLYLEINGANSSSEVTLNGKRLASHDGGYSTYRVNLTDALAEENELIITVDNAPNDHVYPQRADFTFYGGVYRDVKLITVEQTHFDLDYYGGRGFYITPLLKDDVANVRFDAYVVGNATEVRVNVEGIGEVCLQSVIAGECEVDERAVCHEKDAQGFYDKVNLTRVTHYSGVLAINNPHLWDGIKDPFLYTVTARLVKDSVIIDEVSDTFGCRTYRFDPNEGFFLNGRSYPLHGVSRHQDRLGVGNALTRQMHEEDMNLILSMGANSIRLAHYQHDPYFYELCDKKGIVAWAEIPYITVHMDSGRENTISQMKELITQNYNHASIICWALSNEITLQGVTEDLIENHKILNDLVHAMDPTRVSAMANLFMLETDSPLVNLPDIRGYNLYYGWYVGELEDNNAFFDTFHKEHPNTVIGLTEYGADSVISLQSPKPEKGDYTESYMALYHEHMLRMITDRPYLWGTYVWNMFEFAAAGRDEAGDPGKNHKGLITFDRKQKKDPFYLYKAYWSDEPFVHLCGSRYADRIEAVTEVKVYSNQKKISLWIDGRLIGEKEGEHVFTFVVPIEGKHVIRAVSVEDDSLSDEMKIQKVDMPNPTYFADATKVRNWFDAPEEEEVIEDGFLSLNSTMGEIQATAEGAALLDQMMQQMKSSAAGGMGENAKVPKAMMKLIARQPLKKLLTQAGIDPDGEQAKMLSEALAKIPKNS